MPWFVLFAHFIGGAILANGIPHAVMGITGRSHQTPFATPPGVGLSSPVENVLWGFANLAVGYALIHWRAMMPRPALDVVLIFSGALAVALLLARHFGRVRQDPARRGV